MYSTPCPAQDMPSAQLSWLLLPLLPTLLLPCYCLLRELPPCLPTHSPCAATMPPQAALSILLLNPLPPPHSLPTAHVPCHRLPLPVPATAPLLLHQPSCCHLTSPPRLGPLAPFLPVPAAHVPRHRLPLPVRSSGQDRHKLRLLQADRLQPLPGLALPSAFPGAFPRHVFSSSPRQLASTSSQLATSPGQLATSPRQLTTTTG